MIDLWKGSANTWDCDEMGHMNVRIYLEKAFEGLGMLAARCHLSHVYRPHAPSTLIPREQHIRFIREVLPGRPLSMQGCVLEVGADTVTVYQQLVHGDGTVAAAFRTQLVHADTANMKPFPWSARTRRALEALIEPPPEETAPRGLDMTKTPLETDKITRAMAEDQGVNVIGLGMVAPQHCDLFGRMAPAWFIGRVSDSVPNLLYDWRKRVADSVPGRQMGAAVLESRIIFRRWPKAGDLFEIRTALGTAAEKTHSLVHWMLDPVTGQPWMTNEVVALTFDTKARKAIATPPDMMDDLARIAPGKLEL
ncbi:thioesterase family protein [Henriciella aquimarina]|uniref:thioesterase family protein n=1 Tax=Henriciella aquimarina TaxID=545261 RepID=UPI000A07A7D9|nr:thioesterase family protein [Henriciella aquimarina]